MTFRPAAIALAGALWASTLPTARAGETVWLDSLNLGRIRQDRLAAKRNLAVGGAGLSIAGRKFDRGIGTHARSRFLLQLDGGAERLKAFVGVDDESTGTSSRLEFRVLGDHRLLWSSGAMKPGDPAREINLDVRAVRVLALLVTDGGDGIEGDHADWAEARLEGVSRPPKELIRMIDAPRILTPPPPPTPRINGAKVFGVRPHSPVLYAIAATGDRPMTFEAKGLPPGLELDARTGRITGKVGSPGRHVVTLRATNARGSDRRELRIVVGEQIVLTPPLGWNSWNCWGSDVDRLKILQAAEAMAASGLANHGWTYVNIDDGWQGRRGGAEGALQPNEKFPDLRGLCDAVHALGLKVGIYSTPWVMSYAGFPGGSAGEPVLVPEHPRITRQEFLQRKWYEGKTACEGPDARQFAAWGIDYLKYDWNPLNVPAAERMARALRACGRDVVYSLSNTASFEQAGEWARLAQSWRTTGDIEDSWRSIASIGFEQDRWKAFAGPGRWNDADMLVVGHVGWGKPHPSRLTSEEQYTHVSLWCLLASPLLLGCDLTKLDAFTLNLLTNDEVLAVNQDPLGRQAGRIAADEHTQVWAKEMEDGSRAVGLFNLDDLEAREVSVAWSALGLSGRCAVRDLWRQKDLGTFDGAFKTEVPPHGVVLVRVEQQGRDEQ